MYPNYSEPPFKDILTFEINSLIGRYLFKSSSRFVIKQSPVLVDIGVGANYTEGWIHVDFFRSRLRKPWNWKRRSKRRYPEVETDLRYPLNCPSNIADGVYSGHTLEHLWPNHAYQLLAEIYRILKPNCWLRINVPDLRYAMDFYNGLIDIPSYKYKAEAIGNLTQNAGHHSVWDAELLAQALAWQGFVNINQVEFGKTGSDTRLIKEQEVRKKDTLVMEAQKPANSK